MRASQPLALGVATVLALTSASCATKPQNPAPTFNSFLDQVASDCKPLIIGSDNFGQAIVFNGLGANPDNYNNFLGKTQVLYNGGMSAQMYRDSLTAFIGPGNYNAHSFDCIVAHLPKQDKAATP